MKKITDYQPLQRNPNKGNQRGAGILDQSVRQLGAGRSILVDKNNKILAGNHAQEAFVNAGMENVIEVETDGTQIVVVKRTDMDADSIEGQKMAIMDNRTVEVGLEWDNIVLGEMLEEIKASDGELDRFLSDLEYQMNPEIDYDKEWQGMPDFEQEDLSAWKSIIVHFDNENDLKKFADLIKQTVTDKTKSIYYPYKERMNLKDLIITDES